MTRLDEINELYRFHTWAQERMFGATAALSQDELTRDLKNSFPSLRDTLVHSIGAEWVWLTRWQGMSPTTFPDSNSLQTNDDIHKRWQQIDEERGAFLKSLTPDSVDRIVACTNFAGKNFAFPLWQQLRHVVNHGSYHRGQVTTMLKQLGHKPISTDMILLYQEEYPALTASPNPS